MAVLANKPADPQAFLLSTEISYVRELKRWLEEELQVSIDEVEDIAVIGDMLEFPTKDQWRNFRPGRFIHFHLVLVSGEQIYKTFRKGTN